MSQISFPVKLDVCWNETSSDEDMTVGSRTWAKVEDVPESTETNMTGMLDRRHWGFQREIAPIFLESSEIGI
jgi:hypothetical protein